MKPIETLVQAALAGQVDVLSALERREAYRWLHVARDAGHAAADGCLEDLLELSDLRDDEGSWEMASVHWELGVGYLEGSDGLAIDLALARQHLEQAFEVHDLAAISAATNRRYSAEEVSRRLGDEARDVLAASLAFAVDPQRRAGRRVERSAGGRAPR